MKKGNITKLASVFIMASIMFSLGLGTMAYFSDVEMSTDNTLTAGTIDLSEPMVVSYPVEDLKPCEVRYIELLIYNVGENPLRVWKHLADVFCEENGVVEPEEEYYIAQGIVYPPGKNDIDTVMTYDLEVVVYNADGGEKHGGVIIAPTDHIKISMVKCMWIFLGLLEPGESMLVTQSYHLQGLETENWAQSDSINFDIEFFAGQIGGPDPAPLFPLPPY